MIYSALGERRSYATIKRGELKRVKFGKKTLFYATDLAAFLGKLSRLSDADAQRTANTP